MCYELIQVDMIGSEMVIYPSAPSATLHIRNPNHGVPTALSHVREFPYAIRTELNDNDIAGIFQYKQTYYLATTSGDLYKLTR